MIEVEEKVRQIRANILTAQSRQKCYTDKRRRPLEFEVEDQVYLRVSPMKDIRFGNKGNLTPRYISPYPVEGSEKATRGGLNGSQSKFITGTWPTSQNQLDVPFFKPSQDRIAIEKLSTFEIGLGTSVET
jgi:hypothetical protein